MKGLSGKSILLLCPKFFDYEKEIKIILEELGAKVVWYDDRPSNDVLSKGLIRINRKFLKYKINSYYNNITNTLRNEGESFDYLFFVNPEALSKDNLQKMRNSYPAAQCVLYMWDSFKNRRQNIELLPLFDYKYTFDPHDAVEYGLKLRALFYINSYDGKSQSGNLKYDLLFVGTAHSDRYRFVKNITREISQNRIKLYFYLGSKILFIMKKISIKKFQNVKYKDISFRSLSHADIASIMSQSEAILDINHPQQIGLTMRTFETLGAKRKLITTNQDILNYDFYDPCNVLLIDRMKPIINNDFFNKEMNIPTADVLFKYSIKGWAMEIFGIV